MTGRARRAWLLNFDAEDELAAPTGYTPKRAVAARFAALTARVVALLGPGDVVLGEGVPASGLLGRAWCPTPRAVRAWTSAGVVAPQTPPLSVLQRVNHRRFAAELGQTLPDSRFVHAMDELESVLAGPSPTGQFLLKRPFGFAGRGRRKVRSGGVEAAARSWVEASFAGRSGERDGAGLQVEPWVEIEREHGLHGFLSRAGALTLGEATTQTLDEAGAWIATERAPRGALEPAERDALFASAEAAARALQLAGYFGPFGVDAFRWRDARGERCFQPRSEINARYSMGWAIGMGDRRPDLDDD